MGQVTDTYVEVRDLKERVIVEIRDDFVRCTVMVDSVFHTSNDTYIVRGAFENGLMKNFVLNGSTKLKVVEDELA